MPDYLQVTIHKPTREQREVLIALLADAGFEGFEEGRDTLAAFIPAARFNEAAFNRIISQFDLSVSKHTVAEKNWNEEWEKNFSPVIIDRFCAVRAAFHQPIPDMQYEIVITPRMSFGTGHHATTRIMIRYMQQMNLAGKTVLDFGTGTGILAILASLCGASEITAIDYDERCIENATENIAENNVRNIALFKADSLEKTGIYDIILANINRHVILANMAQWKQHLKPGGVVILSGLLPDDERVITAAAHEHQLSIHQRMKSDNWIGLLLQPAE